MSTTTASHFDTSARDWDQRPTSIQLAAVPAPLMARLELRPGDHVLDFGAGTGLLSTAIAPHVAHVTALDMSAAMLGVLAEKGFPNITTLEHDIFEGLPARYDAVVSCMAMHHVADTAALMRAFAAALHDGGRMALVDLVAEDGSFHGDNAAKGVQHFGFAPEVLQSLAEQAGFTGIAFHEILNVQKHGNRSYPLFLMTGTKL